MSDKRVFLTKHSPEFWRVTLNHPPLNIFGPKTIPQLNEVITAIESDKDLKVIVFDSAVEGFFSRITISLRKLRIQPAYLRDPQGCSLCPICSSG
jgi:enoyl-CoA hydratase/carnithine racemase